MDSAPGRSPEHSPMARDGYYFFLPLVALTLVLTWLQVMALGVVTLILAAFVAWFFRDPNRSVPDDPDAVVSPADGKIVRVKSFEEGTEVSIFLSIWNVHVNRSPVEGILVRKEHRSGRFHLAWDDRASVENERVILTISGDRPLTLALVAGVLARRIRVWKNEGDVLGRGDRIGLIRFGSRVDLFFPRNCDMVVSEGDRVYGGSTVLAYWNPGP